MNVKALIAENAPASLAMGGLLLGAMFGAIAQRTGFCTLGAISDWTLFGDKRRARSWLLAIAVAMLGAQLLHAYGVVDLGTSLYRSGSIPVGGHLLGGLLFGFGMVLAGGCVSRNLVRAGAGDLRALLTLLTLAAAVAITLGGVLGPLRTLFLRHTSIAGPITVDSTTTLLVGSTLSVAILVYCFTDRDFRQSPHHLFAGVGLGLTIVLGWALTGLAYDEFADTPVQAQSLTFVKPVSDALDWMKRSTALGIPSFAVSSVAGVLLGALVAAISANTFRLSSFAGVRDTLRNLAGAMLMGVGGVLALGCSIGQGITGLSTLAPGSLLASIAIVAGAVFGIKASERYSILT